MKTYKVGLVGESKYQPSIADCDVGDEVTILHEIDNPHDRQALRVDAGGRTIGYIARDSFLQDAVHEDGKGVSAIIAAIEGKRPRLGVVLDVQLTKATVSAVDGYQRPDRAAPRAKKQSKPPSIIKLLTRMLR